MPSIATNRSSSPDGATASTRRALDEGADTGTRGARPRYPELFERSSNSRVSRHPVLAAVGVFLAAFVALSAVFIGLGMLIVHVMAHSRLGHADEHLNVWFAGHRTGLLNSASLDLTKVADVPGIAIVAAAVTLLLALRRWGRISLFVGIGLALELAVFEVSEHVVARPRPAVHHLGLTPPTYSWPSGHTAATVVLYGGIALLVMAATRKVLPRVLGWLLAVALTLGVGWARIYEGEHHLTDTLGGVLLGVACLCAAILVLRACSRPKERWAITTDRAERRALEAA